MVSSRLLFVSAVLIVAVVAASLSAAAEKIVSIDRISVVQDSDTVVIVGLDSNEKITDGKVTVSVPELGLRARHNVDFVKSDKQTVTVVIPGNLPDDQYVRVVFSSDQGHRIRYFPVIVD